MGDKVMFEDQTVLNKFENSAYKKIGACNFQLVQQGSGKGRLDFIDKKSGNKIDSHNLSADMKLQPMQNGGGKAWVYTFNGNSFALKFKNVEIAENFKKHFEASIQGQGQQNEGNALFGGGGGINAGGKGMFGGGGGLFGSGSSNKAEGNLSTSGGGKGLFGGGGSISLGGKSATSGDGGGGNKAEGKGLFGGGGNISTGGSLLTSGGGGNAEGKGLFGGGGSISLGGNSPASGGGGGNKAEGKGFFGGSGNASAGGNLSTSGGGGSNTEGKGFSGGGGSISLGGNSSTSSGGGSISLGGNPSTCSGGGMFGGGSSINAAGNMSASVGGAQGKGLFGGNVGGGGSFGSNAGKGGNTANGGDGVTGANTSEQKKTTNSQVPTSTQTALGPAPIPNRAQSAPAYSTPTKGAQTTPGASTPITDPVHKSFARTTAMVQVTPKPNARTNPPVPDTARPIASASPMQTFKHTVAPRSVSSSSNGAPSQKQFEVPKVYSVPEEKRKPKRKSNVISPNASGYLAKDEVSLLEMGLESIYELIKKELITPSPFWLQTHRSLSIVKNIACLQCNEKQFLIVNLDLLLISYEKSYTLLTVKFPELVQEFISNGISLNGSGSKFAVLFPNGACIVDVPSVRGEFQSNFACNLIYANGVELLDFKWHSLSLYTNHALALWNDNTIKIYDVSNFNNLEDRKCLVESTLPLSVNSGDGTNGRPEKMISFDMPTDGKGWAKLTLFVLTQSNLVYAFCPVLPEGLISESFIDSLDKEISEDMDMENDAQNIVLRDLLKSLKMKHRNQENIRANILERRISNITRNPSFKSSFNISNLISQGPFNLVDIECLNFGQSKMRYNSITKSDLVSEKPLSVTCLSSATTGLVISYKSGLLLNCHLFPQQPRPRWKFLPSARVISEGEQYLAYCSTKLDVTENSNFQAKIRNVYHDILCHQKESEDKLTVDNVCSYLECFSAPYAWVQPFYDLRNKKKTISVEMFEDMLAHFASNSIYVKPDLQTHNIYYVIQDNSVHQLESLMLDEWREYIMCSDSSHGYVNVRSPTIKTLLRITGGISDPYTSDSAGISFVGVDFFNLSKSKCKFELNCCINVTADYKFRTLPLCNQYSSNLSDKAFTYEIFPFLDTDDLMAVNEDEEKRAESIRILIKQTQDKISISKSKIEQMSRDVERRLQEETTTFAKVDDLFKQVEEQVEQVKITNLTLEEKINASYSNTPDYFGSMFSDSEIERFSQKLQNLNARLPQISSNGFDSANHLPNGQKKKIDNLISLANNNRKTVDQNNEIFSSILTSFKNFKEEEAMRSG